MHLPLRVSLYFACLCGCERCLSKPCFRDFRSKKVLISVYTCVFVCVCVCVRMYVCMYVCGCVSVCLCVCVCALDYVKLQWGEGDGLRWFNSTHKPTGGRVCICYCVGVCSHV